MWRCDPGALTDSRPEVFGVTHVGIASQLATAGKVTEATPDGIGLLQDEALSVRGLGMSWIARWATVKFVRTGTTRGPIHSPMCATPRNSCRHRMGIVIVGFALPLSLCKPLVLLCFNFTHCSTTWVCPSVCPCWHGRYLHRVARLLIAALRPGVLDDQSSGLDARYVVMLGQVDVVPDIDLEGGDHGPELGPALHVLLTN